MTYPGMKLAPSAISTGMMLYVYSSKQWKKVLVISTAFVRGRCIDQHTGQSFYADLTRFRACQPFLLNDIQRKQLTKLWFVFGNLGPQHSDKAHHFIQHFIEDAVTLDIQREFDLYANDVPEKCLKRVCDIVGLTLKAKNIVQAQTCLKSHVFLNADYREDIL